MPKMRVRTGANAGQNYLIRELLQYDHRIAGVGDSCVSPKYERIVVYLWGNYEDEAYFVTSRCA